MVDKRFRGSCETPRANGEVHSPAGVRELKAELKAGLSRKYIAIGERMWQWDFDERFADCMRMSYGYVPEKWLMKNGRCRVVMDPRTEQLHILPSVGQGGINIYGNFNEFRVVPVGTGSEVDFFRNLVLTDENSVEIRNDIFGGSDASFIEKMVDLMVDNVASINTLQLLAKSPFVFNTTEDNLLTCRNFYRELCEDRPAIFMNRDGESLDFIEMVNAKIDPALLDLFGKWETLVLEQLGVPGSMSNSKRAQQSVDEVELFSGDDKNTIRRAEKLAMREQACERMRELWGVDVSVISLIDSVKDNRERGEDVKQEGDDDDE